jgi:hypothetical protein
MGILQQDYNTQRTELKISEYGRGVQDYIEHIQSLTEKSERTLWAHNLVNIMAILNPEIKLQSNYQQVLWGHLFQMANYSLDVDCPYEIPKAEIRNKKPEIIGYQDTNIRFRFYGRNLQNMIERATELEDNEMRQELVNLIASFMYNSCKMWNNENLSNEVIAEHLRILSKGKLTVAGSEITVTADNTSHYNPRKQQQFGSRNNNFSNNRNKNQNPKRNNKGKNYRRF